MTEPLTILAATAASIGLVHTLLGPDHYNLTAPIRIQFRGTGKRMVASKRL